MGKLFNDPWNPTAEEVRRWAFDVKAKQPCQDWDLALLSSGFENIYLDLATDESCPKRKFFLHILYLTVGDAVRSSFCSKPRPIVEDFVNLARDSQYPDLRRWRSRSLLLMVAPESFDYNLWCSGGYARETK